MMAKRLNMVIPSVKFQQAKHLSNGPKDINKVNYRSDNEDADAKEVGDESEDAFSVAKDLDSKEIDFEICAVCFKTFSHDEQLKQHMQAAHGSTVGCIICYQEFDSVVSLIEHVKEHPNHCDKCQAKFSCQKQLLLHYKKIHTNMKLKKKSKTCPDCLKKFESKSEYVEHRSHRHDRKICSKIKVKKNSTPLAISKTDNNVNKLKNTSPTAKSNPNISEKISSKSAEDVTSYSQLPAKVVVSTSKSVLDNDLSKCSQHATSTSTLEPAPVHRTPKKSNAEETKKVQKVSEGKSVCTLSATVTVDANHSSQKISPQKPELGGKDMEKKKSASKTLLLESPDFAASLCPILEPKIIRPKELKNGKPVPDHKNGKCVTVIDPLPLPASSLPAPNRKSKRTMKCVSKSSVILESNGSLKNMEVDLKHSSQKNSFPKTESEYKKIDKFSVPKTNGPRIVSPAPKSILKKDEKSTNVAQIVSPAPKSLKKDEKSTNAAQIVSPKSNLKKDGKSPSPSGTVSEKVASLLSNSPMKKIKQLSPDVKSDVKSKTVSKERVSPCSDINFKSMKKSVDVKSSSVEQISPQSWSPESKKNRKLSSTMEFKTKSSPSKVLQKLEKSPSLDSNNSLMKTLSSLEKSESKTTEKSCAPQESKNLSKEVVPLMVNSRPKRIIKSLFSVKSLSSSKVPSLPPKARSGKVKISECDMVFEVSSESTNGDLGAEMEVSYDECQANGSSETNRKQSEKGNLEDKDESGDKADDKEDMISELKRRVSMELSRKLLSLGVTKDSLDAGTSQSCSLILPASTENCKTFSKKKTVTMEQCIKEFESQKKKEVKKDTKKATKKDTKKKPEVNGVEENNDVEIFKEDKKGKPSRLRKQVRSVLHDINNDESEEGELSSETMEKNLAVKNSRKSKLSRSVEKTVVDSQVPIKKLENKTSKDEKNLSLSIKKSKLAKSKKVVEGANSPENGAIQNSLKANTSSKPNENKRLPSERTKNKRKASESIDVFNSSDGVLTSVDEISPEKTIKIDPSVAVDESKVSTPLSNSQLDTPKKKIVPKAAKNYVFEDIPEQDLYQALIDNLKQLNKSTTDAETQCPYCRRNFSRMTALYSHLKFTILIHPDKHRTLLQDCFAMLYKGEEETVLPITATDITEVDETIKVDETVKMGEMMEVDVSVTKDVSNCQNTDILKLTVSRSDLKDRASPSKKRWYISSNSVVSNNSFDNHNNVTAENDNKIPLAIPSEPLPEIDSENDGVESHYSSIISSQPVVLLDDIGHLLPSVYERQKTDSGDSAGSSAGSTPSKERPVSSDSLGKKFSVVEELFNDQSFEESIEESLETDCALCGMQFKSNADLLEHVPLHM